MIYVGIDPGKSGAVVALAADGSLLLCWDQPVIVTKVADKKLKAGFRKRVDIDANGMGEILSELSTLAGGSKNIRAALEWPGVRRHKGKDGTSETEGPLGAMTLGVAKGLWQGLLIGRFVSYALVHPSSWQTVLSGMPGNDAKTRAVLAAKSRWPNMDLRFKKDHDRAQAAWIAEWCRRNDRGAS